MRILWITNILFPASSQFLGKPVEVSGGWMYSLAMQLVGLKDIRLAVATTYKGNILQSHNDSSIIYFLLPRQKDNIRYDRSLEHHWTKIVTEYKPDVIHIHGTEFAHGLACMRACKKQRYVLSIQGLVSVINEYKFAGLEPFEFLKYTTLNDLIKMSTIIQEGKIMKTRVKNEINYLQTTQHIIGRTSWDYAHTKTIKPDATYHFCNEILRNSFYISHRWSLKNKQNHSIFMSQARSQLKGLHLLLRAMVIIKVYYPNVHLRIAGYDITGGKKWVHRTPTYGNYIRKLIKSLKLQDKVEFLGRLNEERMTEEFRNAHVYVNPSVIENSPNSLGEAQMIGTPCVASFVGGVPDMIKDGESGLLYRFEDYKMLAHKIMKVFENDALAQSLSDNGQIAASLRHDRDNITSRMKDIYIRVSG